MIGSLRAVGSSGDFVKQQRCFLLLSLAEKIVGLKDDNGG